MQKLSEILRYRKQGTILNAALICQRAQEVIGDQARVISCQNGSLKIAVKNNYQAACLAQNNLDLIERINQRLGQETVRRLRFVVES